MRVDDKRMMNYIHLEDEMMKQQKKRLRGWLVVMTIMMGLTMAACGPKTPAPVSDKSYVMPEMEPSEPDYVDPQYADKDTVKVRIQTSKGDMEVELKPKLMPITVSNFMKLVNYKFYDGLTFHRVEDWVIQGGDPEGSGMGGPGWSIKLETSPKLKNVKYAIAMARSQDPDSAGSQFYILKSDADWLDGDYAVFGNVVKGEKVVDKIKIGDKIEKIEELK